MPRVVPFKYLNNLTNKALFSLLKALTKAYDHRLLRKKMQDINHPIANMFYNAWDDTKARIKPKRYVQIGDIAIAYLLWKCITDTAYRGPFFYFLEKLSEQLDKEVIHRYNKEPRTWYINYAHRYKQARKKVKEIEEEK